MDRHRLKTCATGEHHSRSLLRREAGAIRCDVAQVGQPSECFGKLGGRFLPSANAAARTLSRDSEKISSAASSASHFGRALCTGCGQGFVIAFSCKGRGVCPSCNGRHMAQTAAHLVDHVIPPVPVRQWVISVPKRLRCFLANRPEAVAALTKIFLAEIERLLSAAAGVTIDAAAPAAARPRLGAISFLHRFGSALNHHVHLHVCATDGVFVPTVGAPPAFLPARPITQADLAALTEKVRRRVVRWFRMQRLIDADAASDMLRWENSGFSVDASVRITLFRLQLRVYSQPLEHLLRYCARPPFALERLSVMRGEDGRIACVRYVLPRHKAANWVGPGRGRKSTRPLRLMRQTALPRHLPTPKAKLMARVGEEFPLECPGCGGDIRLRGDGRQEPAHFEPEVRKRAKARMALPA